MPAADVAGIAPFSDQLERHLFAAAAEPQGDVRALDAFRLIDRAVNRVILALENRLFLGPHLDNNFAGFAERLHTVRRRGESITVSPPLMFVPARAQTAADSTVAHNVHHRGDLGEQRGVPVALTLRQ